MDASGPTPCDERRFYAVDSHSILRDLYLYHNRVHNLNADHKPGYLLGLSNTASLHSEIPIHSVLRHKFLFDHNTDDEDNR